MMGIHVSDYVPIDVAEGWANDATLKELRIGRKRHRIHPMPRRLSPDRSFMSVSLMVFYSVPLSSRM